MCGGGSRCKARLRGFFFPCCSQSGGAGGEGGERGGCNEACLIPEIQDSESQEPTAPALQQDIFLQILCNHNVFRVKKAFQGQEPHELVCGAEYKGAVSPLALSASRWKVPQP